MAAATNPSSSVQGARIRVAVPGDIEAVGRLINAAFVVERVVIDGDRTSPENVRVLMNSGRFLLAEDAAGLVGCVYIERRGENGTAPFPSDLQTKVPSHFILMTKPLA